MPPKRKKSRVAKKVCSTEPSVSNRVVVEDLSRGREDYPIPVINSIDDTVPAPFTYWTTCVKAFAEMETPESSQEPKGCKCTGACGRHCLCAKDSKVKFDVKKRIVKDPLQCKFYEEYYVECGLHCNCRGKCGRQILPRNQTLKKTELHYMGKKGFGVIAAQPIALGMPVSEYVGDVYILQSNPDLFPKSHYQLDVVFNSKERHYIVDARRIGNITRFMNHSCNSNLLQIRVYPSIPAATKSTPIPKVVLVAYHDVLPGHELTFDYSLQYFKSRRMKCLCYGPNCVAKPKDYASKRKTAAAWEKEEEETKAMIKKLLPQAKDLEPPYIDLD